LSAPAAHPYRGFRYAGFPPGLIIPPRVSLSSRPMDSILPLLQHPLTVALVSIAFLLFLILKWRLQPFLALLLASIAVALLSGMPLGEINQSIQRGMGGILGFIATIIGLGAIFGKLLEHAGGTEALARALLRAFGPGRAGWAMALTGFLVAIPVFLDAGLVILAPILYALTRDSGKPILAFAIPLLAGLAVAHSFIPPTPGPIAVAELLGADLGWVILFGLIVGVPTTIIAGPLFAAYIAPRIPVGVPAYMNDEGPALTALEERALPTLGLVAGLIGLPLGLIVLSSFSGFFVELDQGPAPLWLSLIQFLGHPFTALLLANLAALYVFGVRQRRSKEELMEVCNRSLGPAGLIILVTGAGGVFKQVLTDSGVAESLAAMLRDTSIPLLFMAWLVAAFVRIAQGSATVAMVTAAGLIAPLLSLPEISLSAPQRALFVLSIAAGATILSHVNDSGFWLVSRYLGLTEKQTLQSWTVMETIISVVGFGFVLLCSLFV
jgi:Gnt-I system low-affinity gluconate transporter